MFPPFTRTYGYNKQTAHYTHKWPEGERDRDREGESVAHVFAYKIVKANIKWFRYDATVGLINEFC